MKILIDLQACQTPSSRNRGIGRYAMSLALAMVRARPSHEFWLLLNASFAETVDGLADAFSAWIPRERVVTFTPPAGCQELAHEEPWRAKAGEAIREAVIASIAPDAVHVSSLMEGLTDSAVASLSEGVPWVQAVTLYDLIPLRYPQQYLVDRRVRRYYMRKVDSLRRADLLLGISDYTTREVRELVPGLGAVRAVNISSAIDPHFAHIAASQHLSDTVRAQLDPARGIVMYTGGIDWRKNIEGLLAAYARLPAALRERHQLVLVCQMLPQARHDLQRRCAAVGLGPREVVFTGYVSDADLVALYRACRLFVFPSLHEGFGLPVLEALTCGAVVIASDRSSLPEVLGNDGATFDPEDPAAMAASIERALVDESFRADAIARGRLQAARFSWEETARHALDAIESQVRSRGLAASTPTPAAVPAPQGRPRLAMVTPLPPDRSGIADYAAELLEVLPRHYDITVIWASHQGEPTTAGELRIASVEWFRAHAGEFDRVLYQFGNSVFHAHMFALLRDHPGAVVLHDFYLSGVLAWMESSGHTQRALTNALARAHGRTATEFEHREGRTAAVMRFPCNRWVIDRAKGVIVHSHHACELAREFYGPDAARRWQVMPLLRRAMGDGGRQRARQALGIDDDTLLVCSFGHLANTKLNDRLLDAWRTLPAGRPKRLVFVGENDPGPYGKRIASQIARMDAGSVEITGFLEGPQFNQWLAAADLAVQLRTLSRGETSKAVLDCMAHGVPVLLNANGSMAEYPRDAVCAIADTFTDAELSAGLQRMVTDDAQRARIAHAGLAWVRSAHAPEAIAEQYRAAIEQFHAQPHLSGYWSLLDRIALIDGGGDEADWIEAAIAVHATLEGA